MSITQLPKLWSKHEVAEYLGLNPETVARLCRRRRLGHIMIGNKTKFTDAHIEQYLKDRECAAGSQNESARPSGTSSSTTSAPDSAGELAVALQIARPRNKPSPSTSLHRPHKD